MVGCVASSEDIWRAPSRPACAEVPNASRNFLKLCAIKYYHGVLFYNVQADFVVQTGDPTGTGRGGTSVYGLLYGDQAQYFDAELLPTQ